MNADAGHRLDANHHLEAGEALFRQGDAAVAIFRLESGQVRLLRHTEDGSSVVMHMARPVRRLPRRPCSPTPITATPSPKPHRGFTVIGKRDLLRDVRRDASKVLELAGAMAGQVLLDLRARLEIRNIRAADQRLLAWLRLRARGNPPSLELDRRWTQVAEEIGLTREATYRALSAMRRTGRIRMEGPIVRIAETAAEIVTRLV